MTVILTVPDIGAFRKQAQRGFSLIPLHGKKPLEAGWTEYCHTIRGFNEKEFDGKNAGVCCGPASGVLEASFRSRLRTYGGLGITVPN